MAQQIGISEVKSHFSKILDRVEHGEEFIITRRGKPVAKIVPFERKSIAVKKHNVVI